LDRNGSGFKDGNPWEGTRQDRRVSKEFIERGDPSPRKIPTTTLLFLFLREKEG